MTATDNFKHAVANLLAGHAPNGVAPSDCGEWAALLEQGNSAYQTGGGPAVIRWWNVQTAADKRLVKLMASDPNTPATPIGPHIMSARDLMAKQFDLVKWIVPEILPEGVTIFAGRPKMGKSWLAYNLAIAVAAGGRALGRVQVEQGRCLYMALEDNERRLQSRMTKLLQGEPPPEWLELSTQWPRIADENSGLTYLEGWINAHRDTARLIVIDTLAKIRPKRGKGGDIYEDDYNAVQGLKGLADTYAVGIVVVHHTRKGIADDPLESISGSFGLTGGVDGILVLKRERGAADAVLHVTGRDVEEKELALEWSPDLALWTIAGDAEEYRMTRERRQILDMLAGMPNGMSPKELSDALDRQQGSIKKLIREMLTDGQVRQVGYGRYTCGTPPTHI